MPPKLAPTCIAAVLTSCPSQATYPLAVRRNSPMARGNAAPRAWKEIILQARVNRAQPHQMSSPQLSTSAVTRGRECNNVASSSGFPCATPRTLAWDVSPPRLVHKYSTQLPAVVNHDNTAKTAAAARQPQVATCIYFPLPRQPAEHDASCRYGGGNGDLPASRRNGGHGRGMLSVVIPHRSALSTLSSAPWVWRRLPARAQACCCSLC